MKVISIKLNQQLRLIIQEYRNKLLTDLTQKSKEATSLRTEVETTQFRNAKQQIIAPVDGTIGKLLGPSFPTSSLGMHMKVKI
ncbi:MAG: hypothetical protein PHW18_10795 [Sulfuricurvum sp.]|uniref:hypothetical protein n=1 Tax=Sulfuricurvum sp. TaxID=2025608 RepID=UPI002611ACC6|nr:hypothetical protein [Sulfuricurvum sp.]MDD2830050.1 hypothetical protein [Sulfuricurvum sp.]MDD4950642.1 hypothetical protein [Sulfuricurvum sp.]